jgi:hypothetical protein
MGDDDFIEGARMSLKGLVRLPPIILTVSLIAATTFPIRATSSLVFAQATTSEPKWQKLSGSWSSGCDGSFGAIAVDPRNPDIIYVGSSASSGGCGVYKSADGGRTWSPKNTGIVHRAYYPAITRIVTAPSNSNILYAGNLHGRPFHRIGRIYLQKRGWWRDME